MQRIQTFFYVVLINILLISSCKKEEEVVDYSKELKRNLEEINNYISKENLTGLEKTGTVSNYYYTKKTIEKTGSSQQYPGVTVKLQVKIYDLNGKLIDSTKKLNPIVFTKYTNSNRSLELLSDNLNEGEKATYLVPYTYWPSNGNLDPRKIEIEVTSLQSEEEIIQEYILETQKEYTTTVSGIHYLITKPVPNAQPLNDKSIIEYSGEFLRNTLFYTYNSNTALNQKVFDNGGQFLKSQLAMTLPGFQEAVNILKQGEEGVFIIPAYLMYGEAGASVSPNYYTIPPFSVLLFRLKIK